MIIMQSITACLIFICFLARGHVVSSEMDQTTRDLDGFLDTRECYDALIEADVDNDRRVTSNEYVTALQILGPPGLLENVTDFAELPFRIKTTFNALACLCTRQGETSDCCSGDNAHISNEGAARDETPTSEQAAYLSTVCIATIRSLFSLEQTPAPSFLTPTVMPSVIVPTVEPSMNTGLEPSFAPSTMMPSVIVPTVEPSMNTVEPSMNTGLEPSFAPSSAPNIMPSTIVPTMEPSVMPTEFMAMPTESPSAFPSSSPTSTPPTIVPVAPTARPSSARPSARPSAAPSNIGDAPVPTTTTTTTPSPTQAPDFPIPVAYTIQIPNGNNIPLTDQEIDDLEAAMDILAPAVADEVFNSNQRLRGRRLGVTVQLPTSVVGTNETACPPSAPEQDSCRDVSASVAITEDEEASPEEVKATYSPALVQAINEGRLQLALEEVNPNSRIVIESAVAAPTSAPAAASAGLSAGASAGIAVAAVATFLVAAGLLVARRKRIEKGEEYNATGAQALADADQNARDARELKGADEGDAAAGGVMLGASHANYGKGKSIETAQTSAVVFDTLEEDVEAEAKGDDESSNAGSSGWSSSAGGSSHNTGNDDSLELTEEKAVGAALAATGAASAIVSRHDSKQTGESGSVPNVSDVSRDDLDSAIEAGDWAAVGTTAALLAAASVSPDTKSQSSRTEGRFYSSHSTRTDSSALSSVDAARAAELGHLADAGDWEGVVLAAARFEAFEDGSKQGSSASVSLKSSSATTESRSIGGSTGAASSGVSPSSVSDSESPSKQQTRSEIRAKVESLVRRVVPEEIDNVDEMMLQFKGREEELVESLRTMEERAVAQKARAQGHKAAKREARNTIEQGGVELPVPGATAASEEGLSATEAAGVAAGIAAALGVTAGIAAGTKTKKDEDDRDLLDIASGGGDDAPILIHEDASKSESVSTSGASSSWRRTALELAIEAGDWEAVGQAAAKLSNTPVTTVETVKVQALAEGASYDEEDEDVRRMRKAGVNANRAAELDAMIDEGNWAGVVAAASRYSKVDSQADESSDSSASESREGQQERKRSWFGGSSLLGKKPAGAPIYQAMDVDSTARSADEARREEEDALAQAEIWMAIAHQSKQEGSTDAGASDAADWAIARSLSALRSAEDRGALNQPGKDGNAPDEATGSAGESDSKGDRSV